MTSRGWHKKQATDH